MMFVKYISFAGCPGYPTTQIYAHWNYKKSQNSGIFDLFGKAPMHENILYLNNHNVSQTSFQKVILYMWIETDKIFAINI